MKSSLRQHLSQRCPEHELRQWFDPLRLEAEEDDKRLVITFPHSFFADWFRATVKDHFEEAISQFLEPGYTLEYEISNSNGAQAGASSPAATRMDFPFGRQFTFDTFISNKKNYFPVASAMSVAKNQDGSYNPFCICGESGSGKTHLMRAMANEISKTCDKQRIFFGSLEDLAALIAKARREGGGVLPRQVIQQYHYVFVDDFHRVREDHALQGDIIQLFDILHEQRRQMVFSCPEKITATEYLLPALKSRLEWGLVVMLARQDVDIRARYIQRMCEAKKIRLNKEQMLTLAQRFEDFRYLQGIMLKLYAFKELVHRDIQDEDFSRILEYTENRPEGRLAPEEIQARVAEHFGVTPRDLVGDRRQQNVVFARQMAMFLCRELTGASYPSLGRLFGGKDHSTAMYAVRKVAQLQKENKDVRAMIVQLKKKCS